MSFSSDVKNELANVENRACCRTQQARAMLLFGRECSPLGFSLLTENEAAARAYADAAALLCGVTPKVVTSDSGNRRVAVEDRGLADAIFGELGACMNEKKQLSIGLIGRDCCRAAFLRGAFLSAGTVTNPDVEYHLEFSCPSKNLALDLIRLLEETGIEARLTKRNAANVVYIKKSEAIEELLTVMGATEQSLTLMGAKMFKDVRNTVNRRVNFENANIARCATAAARQTEAIEKIRLRRGLDALPEDLKTLAELRLENPEASTAELVRLLGGTLTVSGVNHRFSRIKAIAETIKD